MGQERDFLSHFLEDLGKNIDGFTLVLMKF
jgi:hypothetical protein